MRGGGEGEGRKEVPHPSLVWFRYVRFIEYVKPPFTVLVSVSENRVDGKCERGPNNPHETGVGAEKGLVLD